MSIQLPTDLHDRYESLADRLDGFDDADDLARYVLDESAAEIERDAGGGGAESADDEVVEDRLEQLGYLEK